MFNGSAEQIRFVDIHPCHLKKKLFIIVKSNDLVWVLIFHFKQYFWIQTHNATIFGSQGAGKQFVFQLLENRFTLAGLFTHIPLC